MNSTRKSQTKHFPFELNETSFKIESELESSDVNSDDPVVLVDSLLKKTDLKFLKAYVSPKLYFLYNKMDGCYISLSKEDLSLFIKSLLEYGTSVQIPMKVLPNTFTQLVYDSRVSKAGSPTFSNSHMVFRNGVMDLKTRVFSDFSPNFFCLGKVAFPYDPSRTSCPIFFQFLDSLCEKHEDRKKFVQVMFNMIVNSILKFQVFFYIYGPSATGKSQIAKLLVLLVGEHAVHSTTLRALQKDAYEIVNLKGKKLHLISDTEDYKEEVSVIKAFTGNDSLRGRIMRQNLTREIWAEGLIVAVGNQPLDVKDTGHAIARRIRPFKTKSVSESREPLIDRSSFNSWTGPLYDEASAIFNWVLSVKPEDYEVVKDPEKHVPSFKSLQEETESILNPFTEWIKEEVRVSESETPLGGKPTSKRLKEVMQSKKFLYPTYLNWCERNGRKGETRNVFMNSFENSCKELGISVQKIRRSPGVVYKGVEIDNKVNKEEYQIGDGNAL